ncbi:universal stress protein [Marinomonas ostreistagni]|uniref:universal stress protein n=1 Tax=Marinomonas ostreistagni TaxID=359209 RepID=UPI00194F4C6B|nr:universal stress protein [Marinomonas ostreistagni]MBM6549912.1 universal stress protein [Marinomonas ostreistagni]
MYNKIMVPVDLGHVERLEKALSTAADLSKLYDAPVCYVGVSSSAPGVAHNQEEFTEMVEDFAQQQAQHYGLKDVSSVTYITHDPAVDLDDTLIKATKETNADLVVMASHVPGLVEHIFASNSGYVASYAKVSVMVIR